MKAKVYVVTKYVVAGSLQEALKRERKQPADTCFLDDCSVKALGDELVEANKSLSTRSCPMKKNPPAVH